MIGTIIEPLSLPVFVLSLLILVGLFLWFLRWFLPAFYWRRKHLIAEKERRQEERMMAQSRRMAVEMGLDPKELEAFVKEWNERRTSN